MASEAATNEDRGYTPITIITTTEDGRVEFLRENLRKILDPTILEDTPIAVVSIAGVKRSGKSFFLNLLSRYLVEKGWEKENEEWLSQWTSSVPGFAWDGGADTVTTGIVAWGQPIIVQYPTEGKKIAVILLDTEGTFDTVAHRNTSVRVFALSTLFSSLQIFNLSKQITLNDLDYLKYFTEQAQVAAVHNHGSNVGNEPTASSNPPRFQDLVFLLRDWSDPDRPYGREGGQIYLEETLVNQNSGDRQPVASLDHHALRVAFNEVSCFLMPEPDGQNVRVRGKTTKTPITAQDLGEEFCSNLTKFCQEYLHPSQIQTREQKAEHLLWFMEQCTKRSMDGTLPDLKDISDLMTSMIKRKSKSDTACRFVSDVTKFITETPEPSWSKFDDFVRKETKETVAQFKCEVQPFLTKENLEKEMILMEQMLEEKAGYNLTQQMQEKVGTYVMRKMVELFVERAESSIQHMKVPNWGRFDRMVQDEMSHMITNFRNEAHHPRMTISLEKKASELRIELEKLAAHELPKQMQERVVPYVTAEVEQHFKTNIAMGISTMMEPSWVKFEHMIHHERSEMITRFLNEVQHPRLTINLETKMKELHNQLENFVKDELTQQMQDRIIPYAMNVAEKFFIDGSTTEINETSEPSWKGFDEVVRTRMTASINKFTFDARRPGTEISVEMEEKLRARLKKYADNELTRYVEERIVSHFTAEVIKHFSNHVATVINEMLRPEWKTFDQLIEKERSYMIAKFRQHVQHPGILINIEMHVQELRRQLEDCVARDLSQQMQDKIIPHVETEVKKFCIGKITEDIKATEPSWDKFHHIVQRNMSEMIKKFEGEVQHPRLTIDLDMKEKELRTMLNKHVIDVAAQQMQCRIIPYVIVGIENGFLKSVSSEINKMVEPSWDKFYNIIETVQASMISVSRSKVKDQWMTIDLDKMSTELGSRLKETSDEELTSQMQEKIVSDMMIKLPKTFQGISESIDGMENPMWKTFDGMVNRKIEESSEKFSSMIRTEITQDILRKKEELLHKLQKIAGEDMSQKMQTRRELYAAETIGKCLQDGKNKLKEHGGRAFPSWSYINNIRNDIVKDLYEKLPRDERDSEKFHGMIKIFLSKIDEVQSSEDFDITLKRLAIPTGSFFSAATVGVILAELTLGPAAILAIGGTVGCTVVANTAMSIWDLIRGYGGAKSKKH